LTRGLIFAENISLALGDKIGKQEAHQLIENCCHATQAKGGHLKEALLNNPTVMQHLTAAQIESLFDPANSLGLSEEWINRVMEKVEVPQ
jgi:3-carboxy-cis,cis-muconate cycloisomerase